MKALLEKLNIQEINSGSCTGMDGWLRSEDGLVLESINPATGERIASVVQATPAIYEQMVSAAQQSFATWRSLPAPKRGLVIRDLANLTREYVEPLGELITLEMGKIRVEGIGEV